MPLSEDQVSRKVQKALRKAFETPNQTPAFRQPKTSLSQPFRHGSFQKISIYRRERNKAGQWSYTEVKSGSGHKHSELDGPFYLRYTAEGRQTYSTGHATLGEAREAGQKIRTALEAKAKGMTVPELDKLTNANRTPIKRAVEEFLELKSGKARKTLLAYRLHLDQFVLSLKNRIRFMDEITADTLRGYNKFMDANGLSGKTRHNRLLTVFFLLKKNDIKNPLPWDERPTVEEEPAGCVLVRRAGQPVRCDESSRTTQI